MNLKQRLQAITELENGHKLPWEIMRIFGKSEVFGSQIVFGTDGGNNDFVTMDELKTALELLVAELGGAINWKPKAK